MSVFVAGWIGILAAALGLWHHSLHADYVARTSALVPLPPRPPARETAP